MELFYVEHKARSVYGCVSFFLLFFIAGGFILATACAFILGGWFFGVLFGMIAAFLVFLCFNCIYGFIWNEIFRFGIRDDVLWWDFPRWPKSTGGIPLDDVCNITIWQSGQLKITTRDGTSQRLSLCMPTRKLRKVLNDHYPDVLVEFIESAD